MCSFPSELQLSEALLMGWQWEGKQMLLSVQLLLILQERGSTALRAQRWAAWCGGTHDTMDWVHVSWAQQGRRFCASLQEVPQSEDAICQVREACGFQSTRQEPS